ncbi:beta-1,3-galactosyltransferase 1-like, partial [Phasianus colchicus]|uniref:beta-1,3-galactosyltransferase 1-like n=1 Tax=Phasianus colchicus TaxID=9054 RepID=UPI00129D7408
MRWPRSAHLPTLLLVLLALLLLWQHRNPDPSSTSITPSTPSTPNTPSTSITTAAFRWLPATRHPLQPPYPGPYRFLLNEPHKCRSSRPPFLVLLVASQPWDVEGRAAIRRTWGSELSVPGVPVVRLFLTGVHPVFGAELGRLLAEESSVHRDILQQDFVDTYHNLTLKTLMGLQWVSRHCRAASYVLKADTDVFLNLAFLVHRILRPRRPPRRRFALGYVYRGTGPLRDPRYKWFVPPQVYPHPTYPPYCAGPAYVLSGDVAVAAFGAAQVLPLFNMEDAFVGVCLKFLGVAVTDGPPGTFNMGRLPYERCRFSRAVMVHRYEPREVLRIWPDFKADNGTCPPWGG